MIEAEATARRASLPTVPETEARKQVSSSAGDCMLDQPKLTWAVDLGNEVRALSTFDLWYALSAGDIASDVKVWRVGREAWTSAMEVPELACALADIDDLVPTRKTLDYVAQPPSFGAESVEREVSRIEAAVLADSNARSEANSEPAIEVIAGRDSHEEVFEHELEEAIDTPENELTPSADLPLGQVISLHPSADLESSTPARRRRAIAAVFAVAATLGVGLSFLVALAAPNVGAEAEALGNAALLPSDIGGPSLATASMFDMEADAMAEASAHRVAERLSAELAATPAEIVTRVKKSWSPSEKGQTRKRATGKPAPKRAAPKKPAPNRPVSKRR